MDEVAGGTSRRWMRLAAGPVLLDLVAGGGASAGVLRLSRAVGVGLMGVVQSARRFFDLDADGAVVHAHLRRDPALAGLLPRPGALRLPGTLVPFELLVRAVVGQQVSVAAAPPLAGRLVARYGERASTEGALTHLFPTPERLAEADSRHWFDHRPGRHAGGPGARRRRRPIGSTRLLQASRAALLEAPASGPGPQYVIYVR